MDLCRTLRMWHVYDADKRQETDGRGTEGPPYLGGRGGAVYISACLCLTSGGCGGLDLGQKNKVSPRNTDSESRQNTPR